ncbi:helix-turn-helix domain-containing protein [Umezawaea sp. Da 62-37]|uniref:helix-turn-helix domain-containing protein n=1 Tax=Umezawaea sp. Da 62-37 TaxID=3075927 RepID=UPI0028F6E263|nr:hypothetical protein [Umezawaea sp. Da 62-37]WNV83053.1 hypothetical protein RM788_33345 [Umezawaea sp. Da 62-37]
MNREDSVIPANVEKPVIPAQDGPDQPVDLVKLEPCRWIVGEQRTALAVKCRWLYEDGGTAEGIAQEIGRSKSFVARLIVEAGGTMRPPTNQPKRHPVPRAELVVELRRRYELGASSEDLARPDIGSGRYVRTLLREAGTTLRKGGGVSLAQQARGRRIACQPLVTMPGHDQLMDQDRSPVGPDEPPVTPLYVTDLEERRAWGLQFWQRYQDGESTAALAAAIGRPRGFVVKLIAEVGGTFPRKRTPEECRELGDRLRRDYERGLTIAELATPDVGSEAYVGSLLRDAGTLMRPSQRRRKVVAENVRGRSVPPQDTPMTEVAGFTSTTVGTGEAETLSDMWDRINHGPRTGGMP